MNQQGAHRYEDRLLEFAYGELPAAEARSIEAHVKGCARCTGALRDIEGVRRQMSQLAPEPAPDAGLDSLLAYAEQAARRTAAGPAPSRGWRQWVFGVVGAASLAAVLVVVGVVANRPELKPASPATIRMEEAKSQAQLQDQTVAAAPPQAVAAPAAAGGAPPANPTPAAQPVAELTEQNKEGDAPAKDALAKEAPPPEPKVGKAVGKGNGYEVQKVDVNSDLESARKTVEKKPLDARYRETGTDRADAMQNMVAGKRTPVLPTTGTQGYAQKTAEAADGEMVFPDTKPGHAAAAPAPAKPAPSTSYRKSAPFQKMAPAPTAPKKKAARSPDDFGGFDEGRMASKSSAGPSPFGGSKGGAKDDSDALALGSSGLGRTRGGGTTDDSGRFGLGSGSTSGAGGTARPSAPPPQAAPPAPGPAARAQQQEAELQAKQRAASQAEASRLDEMRKLEQDKAQRVQRDVAPSAAPAPALEAPASAPSSSRGAPQRVAMNEPPPPPPASNSQAEDEESSAPAQRASIPLSSAGAPSSRKSADAPQPSKVRTVNAQELFLAATKARAGSPEEINGLIIALNAGLGGQYRIDALQRLCVRLDAANDSRAYDYCSAWSSADPSSAVATKRAQSTEERWGPRSKARAAKKASEPAKADTRAPAAVSY